MSIWQPIETVPRDGTEILLKIPLQWEESKGRIGSGDYVSAYWYDKSSVRWMNRLGHWISLDRPTHWMPLPEPPTTKETSHDK